MNIKPKFTKEQEDWICFKIGEWYFDWREKISPDENRLGYAKEELKNLLFNNVSRETCDHRSNGECYLNGMITCIPTDVYKCKYCDSLYKCIFKNGECVGYEEIVSRETFKHPDNSYNYTA